MKTRQRVAPGPLALLTLTVAAGHLLLLNQARMREPPSPPGMRALVTRVLAVAPVLAQADVGPVAARPAAVRSTPGIRVQNARLPVEAASAAAAAEIASTSAPARFTEPVAEAANATPPEAPPPVTASATATEPATQLPAAASSAPSMAFAVPGSVRLRYAVTGQSRGQAWTFGGELRWRHDGEQYEARLEYSSPLLPSRTQHSTGRITAEGLAPKRFSDKGRSEQATHFERESGHLVFSSNAAPVPLLPGAQDRLSVFIQLASMLAAAPAKFPAGTGITLQTAGVRDAEPWLFTVEGDESLELPGGTVATRKLVRNPRRDYDIRVELWLGTAMDYVPVRIRLTQPNGDFVDQQWASTDRS